MKKILITLVLPILLFAFDSADYVDLAKDHLSEANQAKIKKDFSYIAGIENSNNGINSELMKKLKQTLKGMSLKESLAYIDIFYKDSEFLTKEELKELVVLSFKMKENAFNKSHMFILYFFTAKVPKNSTANVLLGVSALQQNGIQIESKQYLTGVPENIESYMKSWKTFAYEYPFKYQNNIVRNFHLKFDPRFFRVYEVKEAPAMALAYCKSAIPTPKQCSIKYLIRGDTSLFDFFDKISEIEPKYKPFANILKANGIYLPKLDKEVNENEKK